MARSSRRNRQGAASPPGAPQPQSSGARETVKPAAPPAPASPAPTPSWPPWRGPALIAAGLMVCAMAVTRWDGHGRPPYPRLDNAPAEQATRPPEGPSSPGEIEARDTEIPVPEALAAGYPCLRDMEAWRFGGYTLDRVLATARTAGVPEPQVERMRALAHCDAGGCSVTPDVALISALGPGVRAALYPALRRFPENRLHVYPFLRPRALGPWSEMRGLDPRVSALFAQGTWSAPGNFAFSDFPWICNVLETDAQRAQALGAIRTRYSLDAWVRVPPSGDLEPMVRYWGEGVRAALLAARQSGGRAHLPDLLPPMARARVGRYPSASDPTYDCFWSAVNFFEGATPSSSFLGPEGTVRHVRTRYAEVPVAEARLGDVFVFERPDGTFAHTANFVAGDVLFSKNGLPHTQPWVLMRLDDLRLRYLNTTLRAYRLR